MNSESTCYLLLLNLYKNIQTQNTFMYDAISYSGILDAINHSFGQRAIPAYRFDNAKVIVSIGADF
jgi:hypothetical protein